MVSRFEMVERGPGIQLVRKQSQKPAEADPAMPMPIGKQPQAQKKQRDEPKLIPFYLTN